MKSIFGIILFLLLIPSICFSQTEIHGSFIIAAICKDGVVIGSDSRGSIQRQNETKPHGYIDSMQKIFAGKDFVIGLMGKANIGQYTLSYLIKEFSDSFFKKTNTSWLFADWIEYLKNKLPNENIDVDEMIMIFASYDNGIPNIDTYSSSFSSVKRSRFYEPDSTFFGTKYSPKMSCKEAAKWIRLAIYEYAERKNKTKYIGGPIYLLKVAKDNSIKWIGNKPPAQFKTVKEVENSSKVIKYDPTL